MHTDFSERPIIVLGVNHSGTRVVVDILAALGSDGGDCDNTWKENKFFLNIHRALMGAHDGDDWTRKIFDLGYIAGLCPDDAKKQAIYKRLHDGLNGAYPQHASRPWHWKCPTSAFFVDFWLETYPEAFYVHIVRDPLDVAQSLISRRQFYSIRTAQRFYDLMESQLAKAAKARHYLKLNYETLPTELDSLVKFLPFLDASRTDEARQLIREPGFHWKSGRSVKHNLWNLFASLRVAVAKRLRGRKPSCA